MDQPRCWGVDVGYGEVWGYFTFDREDAFLNR